MDVPIVVRPADQDDCGQLAALLIEAFEYYGDKNRLSAAELSLRLRAHLGAQPGYEALMAECDGDTVGFAIFAPVFWTIDCKIALFLKEIFVTERARNNGAGKRLMLSLAELAHARGWTRLVWTVDRINKDALGFYRKLPGTRALDRYVYMWPIEAIEYLSQLPDNRSTPTSST